MTVINTAIRTLIGFAVCSRRIEFGTDKILNCKSKSKMVFVDIDLSTNAKKKIETVCEKRNVKVIETVIDVSLNLPVRACKVFGLTDENMCKGIVKELETELAEKLTNIDN